MPPQWHYASDRAGVQPRPQLKPAHTDFGLQPYIPTFDVNTWITTHLLTLEG